MTLNELAAEYRQSAALLRERVKELRAALSAEGLSEMDKLRLRGRAEMLSRMYRDTSEAALVMERYYDRGFKYHGGLTQ